MFLWRISNHRSLAGDGGLRVSARWHSRGRPIVYCAEHPAGALLEVLVHFEMSVADLPRRYQLLKIEAPPDVVPERISVDALPRDWMERLTTTRVLGDAWLAARRSALLVVPSAIVPEAFNVLLNPVHPDASRVAIVGSTAHVVDARLTRR